MTTRIDALAEAERSQLDSLRIVSNNTASDLAALTKRVQVLEERAVDERHALSQVTESTRQLDSLFAGKLEGQATALQDLRGEVFAALQDLPALQGLRCEVLTS